MTSHLPIGILLLDRYGLWNRESSADFKLSIHTSKKTNAELDVNTKLSFLNGVYLKHEKWLHIEMNPFRNESANTFEVIKGKLNVVSTIFPNSDTRHFYPLYVDEPDFDIVRAYYNMIMTVTNHCLRYEVTDDSIIALTEFPEVVTLPPTRVDPRTITYHPRWQFHFKFFQTYPAIPLSFQSPSHQVVILGKFRILTHEHSFIEEEEEGIQKQLPIKDHINVIDKNLIDLINEFSESEFNSIEDEYEDYLDDYEDKIKHDKKVEKFILTKYHVNLIRLLWDKNANHKGVGVGEVIPQLVRIVDEIGRLHRNVKLHYRFYVDYYTNGYVVEQYEKFKKSQDKMK